MTAIGAARMAAWRLTTVVGDIRTTDDCLSLKRDSMTATDSALVAAPRRAVVGISAGCPRYSVTTLTLTAHGGDTGNSGSDYVHIRV